MSKLTAQDQLLLAAQVAARAHLHQKRKDGTPYIAHPVRVALRVAEIADREGVLGLGSQTVSLLHDVVEDTDVTFDELRELGFDQIVLDALDSVTKRPGETYADFVLRAKDNSIGRVVKLADIADNMEDQSALDPEEAAFLTQRYTKAVEVLDGA